MSTRLPNAPPPPAPLSPAEIARYLAYACELLIARRDEVIKALLADAAAYPVISNDDTLGVLAENIRIARALAKTGEDRRKEHKDPFLNGGRAVDEWFRTWGHPLEDAIAPIQKAMNAYGDKKLAAAQARALADKQAADAAAEAAQAAAAQALRHGGPHSASDALDRVAETAAVAEEANARANARPADLTRSYGTYGAVASVRQTWSWQVTDFDAIPRALLMVDPDKVKAAAKPRDRQGKPAAVIPGIAWVAETKVGVR